MKRLKLPDAPSNQTGLVKAWTEPVVIPRYHPLPPDKNPMFLEKRVYQGSSGRVYPLPFTDRISTDAVRAHMAGGSFGERVSACHSPAGNWRSHPRRHDAAGEANQATAESDHRLNPDWIR